MERYIGAEVTKEILSSHEDRRGYLIGDFEQIIDEEVPTADVVEVVRCKDCKNHEWCSIEDMALNDETFFCKYGERRESCTQ